MNNIYRDDSYYDLIKQKRDNSKIDSIVLTLNKILENRDKNMLEGTGYPFMVLYQVRNYEGHVCQEGTKIHKKYF